MLHLKPKFAVRGSEVELGSSFVDPVQPLQKFDEKYQFFFLSFYSSYAVSLFLNFTPENAAHPYFYSTKLNSFLVFRK